MFVFFQNRIKDLKQERKTVEDQMAMAGEELQKAKDLGKMLTDSKTVRDTSSTLLYTSTSFASSMNLSTLYSCPFLCSPVSDFTPVCSQALTCHVNADNHQHALLVMPVAEAKGISCFMTNLLPLLHLCRNTKGLQRN